DLCLATVAELLLVLRLDTREVGERLVDAVAGLLDRSSWGQPDRREPIGLRFLLEPLLEVGHRQQIVGTDRLLLGEDAGDRDGLHAADRELDLHGARRALTW